jgi:hypothetical protein
VAPRFAVIVACVAESTVLIVRFSDCPGVLVVDAIATSSLTAHPVVSSTVMTACPLFASAVNRTFVFAFSAP